MSMMISMIMTGMIRRVIDATGRKALRQPLISLSE